MEDVNDIILNVKGSDREDGHGRSQGNEASPAQHQGRPQVTAGMIRSRCNDVTIINKDMVIATLTEDVKNST